jgi:arginyl-tRNA synthetase
MTADLTHFDSSGPKNLLQSLRRLITASNIAAPSQINLRRDSGPLVDATLFFENVSLADAAMNAITASGSMHSVRRKGGKITLRFADEVIAAFGERLERGDEAGLETHHLLAGKRYFVDFADPNVTKALHVGHLRGIVIGHGFASALRAAGGEVRVLSLVNDIGRNICEAMAGFLEFHRSEDPESAGLKSDVFVGRCYSEYIRSIENAFAHESTDEATIGREFEERHDLADNLLQRWLKNDLEVRELWGKIRLWVLQGHEATLHRLGVHIDRPLYESLALDRAASLADEGFRRGLFYRDARGGLVYNTGRSEYKRIPLLRHDGSPTENLRLAAIWYDLQEEGIGLEACLHIMGDEWVIPIACREIMLGKLIDCPLYQRYHKIGYGMVAVHGSKMKSSDGQSVLIDELLDRLRDTEGIQRLASKTDNRVTAESLAKIVAFGFFLTGKLTKPLEFAWEQFVSEDRNPGWFLARAWSKAHEAPADGVCDPQPTDADYRLAVLQSQDLRDRLREAVSEYDLSPLVRYVVYLATRYCAASVVSPRCDRVMRTTLRAGFASLGLV